MASSTPPQKIHQKLHQKLLEAWRSRLEEGPGYVGVIRADLDGRTVEFAPREPGEHQDAASFTQVDDKLLKRIARYAGPNQGGPNQGGIIEIPVTRVDQSDTGQLEDLGIPFQDLCRNNLPDLRAALTDMSLDAQLSWKAAGLALSTLERIQQEHGPPPLMSGYAPMLRELQTEIRKTIGEVEETTDLRALHQDQAYTIALRTQTILDTVQSGFEYSVYTQREMTIHNINALRTACLKREEFIALREGDAPALEAVRTRLREAGRRMEKSREAVRQSSLVTAITQA